MDVLRCPTDGLFQATDVSSQVTDVSSWRRRSRIGGAFGERLIVIRRSSLQRVIRGRPRYMQRSASPIRRTFERHSEERVVYPEQHIRRTLRQIRRTSRHIRIIPFGERLTVIRRTSDRHSENVRPSFGGLRRAIGERQASSPRASDALCARTQQTLVHEASCAISCIALRRDIPSFSKTYRLFFEDLPSPDTFHIAVTRQTAFT
ncbi:uncharacterized protein SCHCODRAFT_02056793 [Schizophyllum commune H4-8]|uniref:uncharacterized protein n=1 Tax=Schizophyllum commune (strain H4-8 / FGSC 9210) TaxID=578458 RepID=UPI0021607C11|nr:uncharacterized protein SCHCODRAFT_02056793 [Schizophyllum commune H4-8]KAI5888535.1 hypothetical protein SCHCODRAFT_02056793 [Schizophyllum commune H4-8]